MSMIIILDIVILFSLSCMRLRAHNVKYGNNIKYKRSKYSVIEIEKSKSPCNKFEDIILEIINVPNNINKIPKLILQHDYG